MEIKVPKSAIPIISLMGAIQIGIFFFSNDVLSIDLSNYVFLHFFFTVSIIMFLAVWIYKRLDMFSPIVLVSILSFLFFYITPLIDIITKNYFYFGIDVRDGTKESTIIFFVGYLVYLLSFLFFSRKTKVLEFEKFKINISGKSHKIVVFNLLIWLVLFFLSSINLLRSSEISQSFGIAAEVTSEGSGVFSILGYGLVVPWMYIMIISRNKFLKVVITVATIFLYFLNGYRFIIIIMVMAYCSFMYIKEGKRPKLYQIVLMLFVISLGLSFVGYSRNFLRSGSLLDMNLFSMDEIIYTLQGNFGIYRSFYIMVLKMPEAINYTYGAQILYTFILFVPRVFWPMKPDTPLRTLIYPLLGDYAVSAGTAWPNIGEYYSEFGIFGVLIGYIFFSFISYYINKLMKRGKTINGRIAAAILYGTIFQLTIRGYTPSNFWLVVTFLFFIYLNVKFQALFIDRKERLYVS